MSETIAGSDLSVREDAPTIPEHYKGKSIFLTGFTGFVGKLLVEKMLWSCPDLKVIYVLIREKKGVPMEERLKQITDLPVFDRLRNRGDPFMEKLIAIEGDSTLPGLGLSEKDRDSLMGVNFIFHAAASVRFDDPLHKALAINSLSVKTLTEMASGMPNLESFILISTAYVNCHMKDGVPIEEKMYPALTDWAQTITDSEKIDPAVLNILSRKYMGELPNTYVFSKNVAEHIAVDFSQRIPTVIVRPTIVVMAVEEPVPGWLDNMNGPVGLILGYSTGVLRTAPLNPLVRPDYVPVDMVNKTIVLLPWWMKYKKNSSNLEVFNVGSNDKSITCKQLGEMATVMARKYPVKKALWTVCPYFTSSVTMFRIQAVLFQLIPAILLDQIIKLVGMQPLLQKLQIRINLALMALSYFTLNVFNFVNHKFFYLTKYIKKEDFNDFYYYQDVIDEFSLFEQGVQIGMERLLGQKKEDHDFADKKMKIFQALEYMIHKMIYITIFYYTYKHKLYITIPQASWELMHYVIVG